MTRQSIDPIVEFYSGGIDPAGRRLDDILAWDDQRLEHVHDYIQWVFPTPQPSGVNPSAPLVTNDTARAFADDDALRDRLRAALDRMLSFYGLRRTSSGIEIDAARFPARSAVWLHAGNHNHLRLTRIIDSLAALGLAVDARALQRCLLEEVVPRAGGRVTTRTREFWQRAGRVAR
jgi:Opioid growth factor receptor (OGFr) conserved region